MTTLPQPNSCRGSYMSTPTGHPPQPHPKQPRCCRTLLHSSSSRAAQSMQKHHRVVHQKHTSDSPTSCNWLHYSQLEALMHCTHVMHQTGAKNTTRQPCWLQSQHPTGYCKHNPHAMWCNGTHQATPLSPLTVRLASMLELSGENTPLAHT